MKLEVAERRQAKIKMALQGPSGSGKTMGALQIAYGLCQCWDRIAVIDTENYSASLYAHLGSYLVLNIQAPFTPERYNYQYDAIGNMVRDNSESITDITWNVYGKIASITKSGAVIRYVYDAGGNRIMKQTSADTTVYVRDASGNVMSVYTRPAAGTLQQVEKHIYGSSRLGIASQHTMPDTTMLLATGFGYARKSVFIRGAKIFELSNHLGNVLVTVTDRRQQVSAGGVNVDSYQADVVNANDYYPFGMQMPGRKFAVLGEYRYGFNGQEKSDEIDSNGNSMTAEYWQYDARLGRRWNLDPVIKIWESSYAAFANNPISLIDINGADTVPTNATNIPKLEEQVASKNIQSWIDILNNVVPDKISSESFKRVSIGGDSPWILHIGSAIHNSTNVDTYVLQISEPPKDVSSPKQMLEFIRLNFRSLMPKDVKFSGYNTGEGKIWDSEDPTGAIMSFDKSFILWNVLGDDASVLTSKYFHDENSAYWNFTTIYTPNGDFGHPVSGTRQFGVVKSGSGYNFYIRGIDRITDRFTTIVNTQEEVFNMAHETWMSVITNVKNMVERNSGKTGSSNYISKRLGWVEFVMPHYSLPYKPEIKNANTTSSGGYYPYH
ncbi:MAG: ATP-binding protein [Chitinophagaceae bacterium]|nr:ATP-binding protein [Chitinophagaceae bacterium]